MSREVASFRLKPEAGHLKPWLMRLEELILTGCRRPGRSPIPMQPFAGAKYLLLITDQGDLAYIRPKKQKQGAGVLRKLAAPIQWSPKFGTIRIFYSFLICASISIRNPFLSILLV